MTANENDQLTPMQWLKVGALLTAVFLTPIGIGVGLQRVNVMKTCQPGSPDYEKSRGLCEKAGRVEDNLAKYGDGCRKLVKATLMDPDSYREYEVSGNSVGNGVYMNYGARTAGGTLRRLLGSCETNTGRAEDLKLGTHVDVSETYGAP